MAAHDLVIRGGTVVDGTGAPARTADVAITDGVVTEVGTGRRQRGTREIDADGALVTPGFVDIHTHYDGQATWDEQLTPSCWHGVTTVVMGNCGVGFAPVAPDRHEWLIGLMEGVEDIPGAALSRGHRVGLGELPRVPRRARRAPPRDGHRHPGAPRRGAGVRDGRARRAQRAGHPRGHRGDGRHRPGGHRGRARSASRPAARSPTGPSTASPCPARSPRRTSCSASAACSASSAPACSSWPPPASPARTSPRPSGRWTGCAAWPRPSVGRSRSPCRRTTTTPDVVEAAPRAGRAGPARRRRRAPADARPHGVAAARLPDLPPAAVHGRVGRVRARPAAVAGAGGPHRAASPSCASALVADAALLRDNEIVRTFMHPGRIYVLGDPPEYEPGPERSAAGIAAAKGVDEWELLIDLMLVDGGRELLNAPVLNYSDGNLDAVEARCCATPRPPSGSATAAPTPDRPATRRARPSCSRTGPATARTAASPSRRPCTR